MKRDRSWGRMAKRLERSGARHDPNLRPLLRLVLRWRRGDGPAEKEFRSLELINSDLDALAVICESRRRPWTKLP